MTRFAKGAPRHVLITGATRGIGLEFTRQCIQRGDTVFAGVREPTGIDTLRQRFPDQSSLRPIELDVGEEAQILEAAARIKTATDRLDLLIHNAGVTGEGERGLDNLESDKIAQVFRVNVLAPLLLTRACRDLLGEGSRVAALCSRIGALRPPSLAAHTGLAFSYPASKAALHRAIPILAANLRGRGVAVCGLDPGWVRTDMTAGAATGRRFQLEPEQSVSGMLETIERLTIEETGGIYRWNGELARWYAPPETDDELQIATPSSDAKTP